MYMYMYLMYSVYISLRGGLQRQCYDPESSLPLHQTELENVENDSKVGRLFKRHQLFFQGVRPTAVSFGCFKTDSTMVVLSWSSALLPLTGDDTDLREFVLPSESNLLKHKMTRILFYFFEFFLILLNLNTQFLCLSRDIHTGKSEAQAANQPTIDSGSPKVFHLPLQGILLPS